MKPSCLFILLLGVAVVFADSSSDSKSGGSSGSSEKLCFFPISLLMR